MILFSSCRQETTSVSPAAAARPTARIMMISSWCSSSRSSTSRSGALAEKWLTSMTSRSCSEIWLKATSSRMNSAVSNSTTSARSQRSRSSSAMSTRRSIWRERAPTRWPVSSSSRPISARSGFPLSSSSIRIRLNPLMEPSGMRISGSMRAMILSWSRLYDSAPRRMSLRATDSA